MYLARLFTGSQTTYQIRQSFRPTKDTCGYRIIYDLGANPATCIEPFSDHIVLFNQELLQIVEDHTDKAGDSVLEQLLFENGPKEIHHRLLKKSVHSFPHPTPL